MVKKQTGNTAIAGSLSEESLRPIANCLGYLVIHSDELKDKSNNDLIPILASFGFDRYAIASILQTTPETVSVRLSRLKTKSDKALKAKSEHKEDISEGDK